MAEKEVEDKKVTEVDSNKDNDGELIIDDLELDNNRDVSTIIRRASITYIECKDDIHDNNTQQNVDIEEKNNNNDEERDEKYDKYRLELISQDQCSFVINKEIANISCIIIDKSVETRKLRPNKNIIIIIINNWLRTLNIKNCSKNINEIIIEYYAFNLEIELNDIRGSILKKVIEFMEHYDKNGATQIEKPLISSNMRDIVSEWEANFVEIDQETLFELILAANNLKIQELIDLTCAKVASMIKGKTPEEIRKTFNIQNDFTPEEEEAVRAENKWAEQ